MATHPPHADVPDRRSLFVLLAANTISQIGNTLTFMAIPWFVLATTGSAGKTGIAVAVGAIPVVISGIFGGAIVDRLGYRRTSVISDIASGATTLLIPLLYTTIGLAYWQLLVLVFVGAALDSPGKTARRSLLPDLVLNAHVGLERGNAIWSVTGRIADLLGPPMAGLLIAWIGPANLLWIDAATFAVSAAAVAIGVQTHRQDRSITSSPGFRSYLNDIRDGFRFLFRERVILWMVLSFTLGGLFAEPIYSIVLPVYAREVFGSARQLGFIFAALGAGSIIGNGLYAFLGSRVSRRTFLVGGFAVRAVAFWVMVSNPTWWVIALTILISAALFEPINPLFMTMSAERVPAGMRGRVYGASGALGWSAQPVGILLYGFLLEGLGLHPTLVIFAIVNSAVPVAMFLMPSLRQMHPPPDSAGLEPHR